MQAGLSVRWIDHDIAGRVPGCYGRTVNANKDLQSPLQAIPKLLKFPNLQIRKINHYETHFTGRR